MPDTAVSPLTAWENFYVIVGSSAAALTGLQFVVITLIAGTRSRRSSGAIGAFGTPTVVHFCLALLIAAIVSAPWQTLANAAIPLGLTGLGGLGYVFIVLRRARRQTDYKPVLEDWLWHIIFPLVAYAALVIAALVLPDNPLPALFITGAAALLLLFSGIHNAWDTVTYLVTDGIPPENEGRD
ncbi:MAG: hypothetical protein ACXVA4_08430 [Ktedonobacterales bacterium]